MKRIVVTLLAIAFITGLIILAWSKKSDQIVTPISENETSIVGCYAVVFEKDVYTLKIAQQEGEQVSGTLRFNNFQKDSSSGTFEGTYKDGVLLGEYSFQSEGADSVMEVIFKRVGDDFIRGYGEVNETGDRFANTDNITFDSSSPLSVFKATADCPTS